MRRAAAWGLFLGLAWAPPASSESPPSYVRQLRSTPNNPWAISSPIGLCTDIGDVVWIVELYGCHLQKWTTQGEFLARYGGEGSTPGLFFHPSDVIVDADGHLWIADRGNHRLQCWDRDGHVLSTYGSLGRTPGKFISPAGMAIRNGILYVTDTYNHRIQKFAIHDTTLEPVGTVGDSGRAAGQLISPTDLALTPDGKMYVVDNGNNRIQVFSEAGVSLMRFGGNEAPSRGVLAYAYGVLLDLENDRCWVTETFRRRIDKFSLSGVYEYSWGAPPNPRKVELLTRPLSMTRTADGGLLVADLDDAGASNRVVLYSYTTTPVVRRTWTDLRRAYRGPAR